MPNLIFTEGNDSYTVTTAGDYWLGFLGGNDTLTVNGGTTTTGLMGEGNDLVKLKSGSATVYGESGADHFQIWAPSVFAYGGGDNDRFELRGGSGQALYGDAGVDSFYFLFNAVDITIGGGDGNDVFKGRGNSISGNIDGGAGNDTFLEFNGSGALVLYGGAGNDTFRVDIVSPATFVEISGEGFDTAQVPRGLSYTLPDTDIEKLLVANYAGSTDAAATLTGNAIDNVIISAGNADSLYGLDGRDSLYGNDGDDTLNGGNDSDRLYGGNGSDILNGDAGNDRLDGGIGVDVMSGGLGHDIYYVNNLNDLVNENTGEGTDTVRVTVDGYTLPNNVENGEFFGVGHLHGNALDNSLTNAAMGHAVLHGLEGNDILTGGGSTNDWLNGGLGDDTYVIQVTNIAESDLAIEAVGEGTDAVYVTIFTPSFGGGALSYTLPGNVENGTLQEHDDPTLFTWYELHGNALDNILVGSSGIERLYGHDGHDTINGGAGNDLIVGGAGADSLTGGAGNDVFDYDFTSESYTGNDAILDFTTLSGEGSDDQIDLSGIDANTDLSGNQPFTLNATGAPAGVPGDLWYTMVVNFDGTVSATFYGDVNGDSIFDFQLLVLTVTPGFEFDDLTL